MTSRRSRTRAGCSPIPHRAGARHPPRGGGRRHRARTAPTRPVLLDNLMMGAHVIEQAAWRATPSWWRRDDLRLPEVRAGPVQGRRPLERLPGGDQRALRHREEDDAGRAQAYRDQYGMNSVVLLPGEPVRAARQLRSRVVARHPGDDPQVRRGAGERRPEVVLWGDGTPTREFLYVDDAREAILLAAERYDGATRSTSAAARRSRSATWPSRSRARPASTGAIRWDTRSRTASRGAGWTVARRERFGFEAAVPLSTASPARSPGNCRRHQIGAAAPAARPPSALAPARPRRRMPLNASHRRPPRNDRPGAGRRHRGAVLLDQPRHWLNLPGRDQIKLVTSGSATSGTERDRLPTDDDQQFATTPRAAGPRSQGQELRSTSSP